MTPKNKTAGLIPYRKRDDGFEVYLQKRTKNAPTCPDMYGFFGGHVETREGTEEALIREIREELDFSLSVYKFLGEFEGERDCMSVFFTEVEGNFESIVTVREGQYGRFIHEKDVFKMSDIRSVPDKVALRELFDTLHQH